MTAGVPFVLDGGAGRVYIARYTREGVQEAGIWPGIPGRVYRVPGRYPGKHIGCQGDIQEGRVAVWEAVWEAK